MTKADLIEEVSRLAELTRKDSEIIVETIFDSVVRSLRSGDKIEIRGFGSFRTRQRKPRVGRNPKTGARVDVPAKKIPYFKPSKELKDVINHGKAGEAASPSPASEGQSSQSLIPITASIRPVWPFSARCEKKLRVLHAVQCFSEAMFFSSTPNASNCRRLASRRLRCSLMQGSPCPGARAFIKSRGYFSRTGSDSCTV